MVFLSGWSSLFKTEKTAAAEEGCDTQCESLWSKYALYLILALH